MNFRVSFHDNFFVYQNRVIEFHERFSKILFFVLLISGAFSFKVYSQQSVSGIPFSQLYNIGKLDQYEVMQAYSEVKTSLKASQVESKLKKLEFAHVFDLALNPENSGDWVNFENGDKLWRVGLVSKGAFSLNLIFGLFNLEPGVKVYVYSPDQQHFVGAFSSQNNSAANSLAIEPIPGDSIIVELNIPNFADHYGFLEISKLGHDFMNIFGSSLKNGYGIEVSGACNADINCNSALEWQVEKYAVCKLIVNARDLCTGTLVNNTAKDFTPYVLTANHCIDTLTKAANTVFIFNYEKWKCGGQDGPKSVTLSGSQLIATTTTLDFSLVKLYGLPPFSCKPYFAGWDRSNSPPLSSSTIHHPNGDFKKISMDSNPATTATFPVDYNANSHWMIGRWEVGTTERGSSGAPLFNQNHLLVGDLTGGDATCAIPVKDYFAKFAVSWSFYNDWKKQLKHWLDPLNIGSLTFQGLDPYEAEKTSCDTFWNIANTEPRLLYNSNLTWGAYSGHNSKLTTQFAEKIEVGGALKIAGLYLHVAKAYNASPLSYITIKLWKDGVIPGKEITSRSVYIKDLTINKENYLEFDSIIFINGPVYIGFAVNYSASQDTVALFQSADRGASGLSGMYVYKDNIWKNISENSTPALYSSLAVGLISCSLLNGEPDSNILDSKILHLYPNPVNGTLHVDLPHNSNAIVSVFDLAGRKNNIIAKLEESSLSFGTENLTSGIYILKILIPGKGVFTAKFMVIK